MKIYYDSTVPANGIENLELTGIKIYPVPISMMDKIGSCAIVLKDFEGSLYDTWKDLNFRKIRIEDDSSNVIWRGYIERKDYEHNKMTLGCRGIAALLDWKNFTENYILEEGLIKTVPLAGGDDSRLELKQNDQDAGFPDFVWPPDYWHVDQDVGIIVYDTTNSNDETAWTCLNVSQANGVEISGNAASLNGKFDNDWYYCSDDAGDIVITPVIGGDNIATTDAIKKITIAYHFALKTDIEGFANMIFTGCGRTLAEVVAHATTNWVHAEGTVVITGTDAELSGYLTVDGGNYDEIPLSFSIGMSDVIELAVDYVYVTIESNPIDYDQVMYAITDNDTTWIAVAGVDWDDDTGVTVDDAFKIGQNTRQILWDVSSRTGIGINIQSTLTKYIARHFKGHNCFQILKTICDLEGCHWWEDYANDQIVVSFEADFVASGATLTDADYDFDWKYEDNGNNYSRVDVFGAAALSIHGVKEDPDIDSPKEFTIIDELIVTNADAQLLAEKKFVELSVKVPSIMITLNGVQSAITVGDTVSLALSRPTKAAATYPVRRIERAKRAVTGIKTIVYCGMGKSPLTETIGTIVRENALRAQKALSDRLISTPLSGIGGSIGVNWIDVAGRTVGVESIITDEIAPGQSIGIADDAHQAAAEATASADATAKADAVAAALAAHHLGATNEHDGIYNTIAQIAAFKLNKWQPPDAAVPMNAQKLTGVAKGTDANDALTLGGNLDTEVYDPTAWEGDTDIAASKQQTKDVFVRLTGAVFYMGTWTPDNTGYPSIAHGDAADPKIGDWWLCDADGYHSAPGGGDNTPARWYEIGDWIIWNDVESWWDHLRNVMGDNVLKVSPGDSIQVAIDELESIGEGAIVLLPGTHNSAALTVNDVNVYIEIYGFGDVSILKPTGDFTAITATNFKHLTLKNFKIDCSNQTTVGKNAIYINEVNDNKWLIENITGIGDDLVTTDGIRTDSEGGIIRNCNLSTMRIGYFINITAHSCKVYENHCDNIGLYGFFIRSNYSTYADNFIEGNGEVTNIGMRVAATNSCSFTDNYVNDCEVGIKLEGQSDDGTYIGNSVLNCSVQGIFLDVGDHNSITANVITDCGDGIELGANASNNYITVNQLEGNVVDIDDNSDGTNYILNKETDIIDIQLAVWSLLGSNQVQFFVAASAGEAVLTEFTTEEYFDVSQECVIKIPYQRDDAGGGATNISYYLDYFGHDGGVWTQIWDDVGSTLDARANGRYGIKSITIPANTIPADATFHFYIVVDSGHVINFHPMNFIYHRKSVIT